MGLSCFTGTMASMVPSLKDIMSEAVDLVGEQGFFEEDSLGGELEILLLGCSEKD